MSTDLLTRREPATAPIEPKLRARRIEVARDQGRRRLRRMLIAAVVVALVAAAVALTQSPLLDVDQVAVRGATGNNDLLRSASGIAPGEPMVGVDEGAAVAGLEGLPWVAEASVRRTWPGTVTLTVTQRTPVAVLGRGSAAVLVDGEGQAIGPATDPGEYPYVPGRAPEVGGNVADGAEALVAVLAEMPDDLRSEVAEIADAPAGTMLVLRDDIEVLWGDTRLAGPKADALRVLLDEVDRSTIEAIDVSVPRATTVTPIRGEA